MVLKEGEGGGRQRMIEYENRKRGFVSGKKNDILEKLKRECL